MGTPRRRSRKSRYTSNRRGSHENPDLPEMCRGVSPREQVGSSPLEPFRSFRPYSGSSQRESDVRRRLSFGVDGRRRRRLTNTPRGTSIGTEDPVLPRTRRSSPPTPTSAPPLLRTGTTRPCVHGPTRPLDKIFGSDLTFPGRTPPIPS